MEGAEGKAWCRCLFKRLRTGGKLMAIDPVCRMTINEEKAVEKTEYNGKAYYFCGKGCKDRFEKEPEKYLRGEKKDWIKG